MSLTTQQLADLKTDILANSAQEVVDGLTNGDNGAIANWYNAQAVPDHYIWDTTVHPAEVERNGFVWTEVDNLTNKQLRIWDWMRDRDPLDASLGNVRKGVNQAFGKDSQLWNAVMEHLSRLASNADKLFATGNNNGLGQGVPSTSPDSPRKPGIESELTVNDISQALQS